MWNVRLGVRGALMLLAAALAWGVISAHRGRAASLTGIVSFAEQPQAGPNYIFPFMPGQYNSVFNAGQFQALMYRPLYWFGRSNRTTADATLSIGRPPRYEHGNRVVLSLKPYRWSDGEAVTGQDIVFFMNMYKVEKFNFGQYAPGAMPDNVKSVVARGNSVVFTLTHPVNPQWFTDDELGQITPFPVAWDVTSLHAGRGSAICANATYRSVVVRAAPSSVTPVSPAAKSCAAVFEFLSRQAGFDPANPTASKGALGSYATNPLWQVVDGPWHLTAYTTDGFVAMKPNPSYSGPVKATISEFDELPFTSASAEFNALAGNKVSIGYLPFSDITSPAKSATVPGRNNPRLANYNLQLAYLFYIGYEAYNFNSTGDGGYAGRLLRKLYIRQALQLLADQRLYDQKLGKGYGYAVDGPVPPFPPNPYVSGYERANPYPYDPARALSLLRAHGWQVVPHGTSVCAVASACGVPAGTRLEFTLVYAAGDVVRDEVMAAEAASWSQAGIHVIPRPLGGNTVAGEVEPCSGKRCSWEIGGFGGWVYGPYPSGEQLFTTGAAANVGSYSDSVADRLIHQSITTPTSLTRYENYIARQLPVLWQPDEIQLPEVQKQLTGVRLNAFGAITPEEWRLK
jgi:peptide/nickel transport system substrate-binding protein